MANIVEYKILFKPLFYSNLKITVYTSNKSRLRQTAAISKQLNALKNHTLLKGLMIDDQLMCEGHCSNPCVYVCVREKLLISPIYGYLNLAAFILSSFKGQIQ